MNEITNISAGTRLLEKRRKLYEVTEALEIEKEKFNKEEENFKKKEELLRTKDLQLQHQLIRFNKFLQDNESKRRRAEARAAEEGNQIKQKEREIAEYQEQLDESKRQLRQLEEEVARNLKFETFLNKVKDSSEDYSEVAELMARFDTLEKTNLDLLKRQEGLEKENEVLRVEYQTYKKDKGLEILENSNKISFQQTFIEGNEKDLLDLEVKVNESTQQEGLQGLKLEQIIMSVENIFIRLVTKRPVIQHYNELGGNQYLKRLSGGEGEKSLKSSAEEAIKQLRVIGLYIKDLKDIVENKLNRKSKK